MSKISASNQIEKGSKETILYLNTGDGAYFNDNGDYSWNLFRPLTNVKNIQLVSYNVPWTFPNVTPATNILVFSESNNPTNLLTVTLPVGQYADEDIVTQLGLAMSNAGHQIYTITENFISSNFTIVGSLRDFTLYYASSTLASLIGLEADTTSSSKTLVLGQYDLVPSTELQIRLPNLINIYEGSTTNLNFDLIQSASLSGYQYGDLTRENQSSVICATTVSQISQIVVSVTDQSLYTPFFDPDVALSFLFRLEFWN
jgi:hypothetical protein